VDSLYMNAFDACAIFRESCYHCKYAQTQRVGDCSLADFWGIGRYGTPFKYDVLKGVSLVLVNNQKGEEALNGLQDTMIEERTLKEALIENHTLSLLELSIHQLYQHLYGGNIIFHQKLLQKQYHH
jgi:F420H2 dehydrogenase subunit F